MLQRDPKKLFLRYADKGDTAALGRVFDLLAPELLSLAVHLTRRADVAEDVVQDTFVSAVEGAARFDRSRPLRPWFVGILVNRARKANESLRGSRPLDGEIIESTADGRSDVHPDRTAASDEVHGVVEMAIQGLSDPYREVVRAHVTDGLPPREIAERLERAPGTVRVQLHRGLDQLRASLDDGSGLGRLQFLGLSPTAALLLGDGASRGLAAIREAVVAAGDAQFAASAGLKATATAGGAKLGSGTTIAACAAIGGAAAASWVLFFQPPAPVELDRSLSNTSAPKVTTPLEGLELAEVEPPRRQVIDAPSASGSSVGKTRARGGSRQTRQGEPDAQLDPEVVAAATLPKLPFRVEPFLDSSNLDQFDAYEPCRYHARLPGAAPLMNGQSQIDGFVGFSVGEYEDTLSVPPAMIVHFDYPDALPVEVVLGPHDWMLVGDAYIARPVLMLDPIRRTATLRAARNSRVSGGRGFVGDALLVRVSSEGRVTILDNQRIDANDSRHKSAKLRVRSGAGDHFIVGMPRDSEAQPMAFRPELAASGHVPIARQLINLPGRTRRVRAMDPFGRPYEGAVLRAKVKRDIVRFRSVETDAPAAVHGFVFCDARAMEGFAEVRHLAQSLGHQGVDDVLMALGTFSVESDDTGWMPVVHGIEGVHEFTVSSPLSEEELPVNPFEVAEVPFEVGTDYVIDAPVGGVEVQRPPGLRQSAEEWVEASITVVAGDLTVTPEVRPDGSVRALVPPHVPVQVVAIIDGARYTGRVNPLGPGQRGSAKLAAVEPALDKR